LEKKFSSSHAEMGRYFLHEKICTSFKTWAFAVSQTFQSEGREFLKKASHIFKSGPFVVSLTFQSKGSEFLKKASPIFKSESFVISFTF
jgi:hypothetical protein